MNISYEIKNYTELTALSGTYPTGVKFPQIFLRRGHNRNHIGGFIELKEYLEQNLSVEDLELIKSHREKIINAMTEIGKSGEQIQHFRY